MTDGKGDVPAAEGNGQGARGAGLPDAARFPLVLGIVGVVSAGCLSVLYSFTRERMEEAKTRKVRAAFASIVGPEVEPERMEAAGGREYYVLRGPGGRTSAYAAKVKCPGSYNASQRIELIVILDPALEKVLGARVVKSAETPGLGERVNESPSANSIVGSLLGRPPRERVVLGGGGVLVGTVSETEAGLDVTLPSGEVRPLAEGEYVERTKAPFPPWFLDQLTGLPVGEAKLASSGGRVDAITGATVSSTAVMEGVRKAEELLKAALAE